MADPGPTAGARIGPPPTGPTAGGGVGDEAAQGRVQRVVRVLAGVLPVLRGVRMAVTVLAALAAAAVVAFWTAWATTSTPGQALEWLALVVLGGVLLVPSGLLLGARWMLTGLVELPDRLRAEPGIRRDQIDQLTRLAAGDRSAAVPGGGPTIAADGTPPGAVPSGGPLRRAWSAGRIVVGARSDLLGYTALLRLASLSYLASAFLAAALALLEVVVLFPAALILVLLG